MKIKRITKVGNKSVFDLSVQDGEHYVLENGVVTHNTGVMYSADTVIIIGRQQDKDGTELLGYNFILNSEKSRFVREKSKIPLNVSFEGGINVFSGLLDIAIETGHVVKPSNGWFSRNTLDVETGEMTTEDKKFRRADTDTKDFWAPLFKDPSFNRAIMDKYQLGSIDSEMIEVEDLYS